MRVWARPGWITLIALAGGGLGHLGAQLSPAEAPLQCPTNEPFRQLMTSDAGHPVLLCGSTMRAQSPQGPIAYRLGVELESGQLVGPLLIGVDRAGRLLVFSGAGLASTAMLPFPSTRLGGAGEAGAVIIAGHMPLEAGGGTALHTFRLGEQPQLLTAVPDVIQHVITWRDQWRWLASDSVLYRLDGVEATPVLRVRPPERITGLAVAPRGGVLVGGSMGILYQPPETTSEALQIWDDAVGGVALLEGTLYFWDTRSGRLLAVDVPIVGDSP